MGETQAMTSTVPILYFPRRGNEAPEPVPFLMTEAELIRFLRLDETATENLDATLFRYRKKGLLRATQVGRCLRYRLPDVLAFLENAQELNPR